MYMCVCVYMQTKVVGMHAAVTPHLRIKGVVVILHARGAALAVAAARPVDAAAAAGPVDGTWPTTWWGGEVELVEGGVDVELVGCSWSWWLKLEVGVFEVIFQLSPGSPHDSFHGLR